MYNPFKTTSDYVSAILTSLPDNLYYYARQQTSNLYKLMLGLFTQNFYSMNSIQTKINSLSINIKSPDPTNVLLDRFIATYGINKLGLFELNTPTQKATAIALFLGIRKAVTRQDIVDVFYSLGYTIKIYDYTDYNNQFGVAKYGVAKYNALINYTAKFTLWINIQPNNYVANPNSKYGISQYGTGQYGGIFNLTVLQNVIKKLFPCYIQIIFIDN